MTKSMGSVPFFGKMEDVPLALEADGTPPTGTWYIERGTHVEGLDSQGREITTITFVDVYGKYVGKIFILRDFTSPDEFKSHVAEA